MVCCPKTCASKDFLCFDLFSGFDTDVCGVLAGDHLGIECEAQDF